MPRFVNQTVGLILKSRVLGPVMQDLILCQVASDEVSFSRLSKKFCSESFTLT